MRKIYTVRDAHGQQQHLWEGQRIDEEVAACPERTIAPVLLSMLSRDAEIVEAGCGLGAWVIFLREQGFRIMGIDNNEHVIRRLKQRDPDLPVAVGDISDLPYDDGSLGAYISLGVVEHFEEGPENPLREAFRVLREGGLIFLTVPYNNVFRKLIAHPLREIFLLFKRMRGGKVYFAEYRYSESEVVTMVERAGFQVMSTDIDDFIEKTRSLTLWSEFPFLRGSDEPFSLNAIGKLAALLMNSLSRRFAASGILVIARKPPS